MSYFEELSIQGIRCFGPEDTDMGVIQFGCPLTLILGNNGCGKTTIIEALNYATTGKKPPGCEQKNDGVNFVHDPKLIDRAEIKGKIQLKLKDAKGETVSVTRSVQVTYTGPTPHFKSLDQTISRMDDDGRWHELNGRCADVDIEMCQALGVSRAVLVNVLLCHQEDSNWPLDTDKTVKTKFDQIFGSKRYTNCLDEIKNTLKKLQGDESKLKQELEHLKNYKEEASTLKKRLQNHKLRFNSIQIDVEQYQAKLDTIQKQLEELSKNGDSVAELQSQLERFKSQLVAVTVTINNLRSSIHQIFNGPTEELSETLNNFHKQLDEKNSHLEQLQNEDSKMQAKLAEIELTLSTQQVRLGQLTSELDANNRRVDSRNQTILSLSGQLGLDLNELDTSQDDKMPKLINEFENAIMQRENDIHIATEKNSESESSLQQERANLREKRAKLEGSITSKKEQLQFNEEELEECIRGIEKADQSSAELSRIQTKLVQHKKEYDKLLKSENADLLKSKISSANSNGKFEEAVLELEAQVSDLQLLYQVQAELDVLESLKATKDAEMKMLKTKHGATLKEILELDELPEQGLERQLEARMNQLADTIESRTGQLVTMEKRIAIEETEHEHLRQHLTAAQQQLITDESAIKLACGEQEYDDCVAEMTVRFRNLQEEKSALSSSSTIYRNYIQKLQKTKSCPLCKRGFECENSVSNLITELNQELKEAPTKINDNQKQLHQVQENYEKLLKLKSKHEEMNILKNGKINELERNLERSAQEITRLKNLRSEILEELEILRTLEALAQSISNEIAKFGQNLSESHLMAKKISELEEKLKTGSGTSKTLQEAADELKEGRKILQQSRKTTADLETTLRNFEAAKIKLKEERIALEEKQLTIISNSQKLASLIEKKGVLEGIKSSIQIELEKLTQELASISSQIQESETNFEVLHKSNNIKINCMTAKLSDMKKTYEDIKQLNSAIIEYENTGGKKKLKACKTDIERIHKDREELNEKRQTINEQCESMKKDIHTQESRKRDLKDNVMLKEAFCNEKVLLENIAELDKKIGGMDLGSIVTGRQKLEMEEKLLFSSKKEAEGRMSELKTNIESVEADLEKPHLKNAESQFCKTFVHAEVIEQAKKDLNNFYRAMYWATWSYHQKKIKHLNTVINELWRKVYSGNDIDSIQIRAELDPDASAAKRQVMNYRVVQTKCGVDLDMRNRCSAGQKVLACLIIRMALAETFSSRCGILALDEPTTNLDQEHIIFLSRTLRRLVKLQSGRKNFQLLVITHDKEFLDEMTKCGLGYYYQLERNTQGKSKIKKINLD